MKGTRSAAVAVAAQKAVAALGSCEARNGEEDEGGDLGHPD
jgi:hypothetical protein